MSIDVATGRSVFARLSDALGREALGQPTLVLDLPAVDRNLRRARADAGARALRVVVKSLPCPALLERAAAALGTSRFMCFHRPFLQQVAARFPEADVLLGKPLPVAAAAEFYRRHEGAFDPSRQLAWLVDTRERLARYLELARSRGLLLRVAIEIDVGLHRGGVPDPEALDPLLALVRESPRHLRLAGFMGYDAHAAKAPWPATPEQAASASSRRYAAFVDRARSRFPGLLREDAILNGGGSPTFSLHQHVPPSEVAIGSVIVKPSDFDLPQLAAYEPAAFVALPVLKRLPGVRFPFLEALERVTGARRDTLFVYGGRLLARPFHPPGLRASRLFGESSNQSFLSVPREADVGVDDYVYFRPTQSEAVLAQLGPIAAVDEDGRLERWPVLSNDA